MQTKKHKPHFLTVPREVYEMQIADIVADPTMTDLQKSQSLNRVWKDAQRQFGFYSPVFKQIAEMIEREQKSRLQGVRSA